MADLDDIKDGKDFRTDQPQKNIPFTLKGCGALDWGMQSRLSRIFNPKTGKTVMLAFDHGYFQGPTTGLERIDINIAPLFEHADVLMCTRGILRSVVPPATNRPVVLRASGANSILAELSNEAVALSMDDAVRLNSCAVAAQVYIGSEYEHQSIKNIIQLVDAGMKVGMPTMAVTGVGKDMVRDQRYFSLATRIAAETQMYFWCVHKRRWNGRKNKVLSVKAESSAGSPFEGGGSEEAHCVGKGDDDSGGDRPAWDQPEFLL